ncbi:hypothetical protein [Streptacidiphilus sp. MAP5-3]|uniref:hypothetical protein n=1 Tax=unclassified Streptacidiphilus TaxID=2643834 RepID=UPI003515FB9C
MSQGYEVNLDQLEVVVRGLRAVADSLEHPKSSARYDTTVPPGMLGTGFDGAASLTTQHGTMQDWLEGVIGQLQDFINTHAGQTKQAADAYGEQEYQTKQDLYSAGGN